MLNDPLCTRIAAAVRAIHQNHRRNVQVSDGRRFWESLEAYFINTLLPQLRQLFPAINHLELGVVALMVYLGPPQALFPPRPLRDELINLVNGSINAVTNRDPLKLAVELVIAYGCQRERVRSGLPQWDTHWAGAVRELTDTAFNFIIQTTKQLRRQVRGFTIPDELTLRMYAAELAAEFIAINLSHEAEPNDPIWQPERGNLYGWLRTTAILGGSSLLPNMFQSRSRLFEYLRADGLLDVGWLAFQRGVSCDHEGRFNGRNTCGQCDGRPPTYVKRKRFFFPPADYVTWQFWSRPQFENHYHRTSEDCPICRGSPVSQRPTYLYVCVVP